MAKKKLPESNLEPTTHGFRELARSKAAKRSAGLRIKEGEFKGIRPDHAVRILVSESSSFYGHKQVIFAGFRAWLFASRNQIASRRAIALETARLIGAAEEKVRGKSKGAEHVWHKMLESPKYQPLMNRIYNRIGGMRALVKGMTTSAQVEKLRRAAKKEIPYIVGMAHIWDYHVRELSSDSATYGKPNIEDAAPLAHEFVEARTDYEKERPENKQLSASQIRAKHWPRHHKSIAFLYGADHTRIGNHTVLELLLAGKLTLNKAERVIPKWFSYASYFERKVLPERAKGGVLKKHIPSFSPVAPKKPQLPKNMDGLLKGRIRDSFKNGSRENVFENKSSETVKT